MLWMFVFVHVLHMEDWSWMEQESDFTYLPKEELWRGEIQIQFRLAIFWTYKCRGLCWLSGWDGSNNLPISNQYNFFLLEQENSKVFQTYSKSQIKACVTKEIDLPQLLRISNWNYVNTCNLLTLAYNVGRKRKFECFEKVFFLNIHPMLT